jgi:hypothetical protein
METRTVEVQPQPARPGRELGPIVAAVPAPSTPLRWPLERVLFLMAGTMTLISVLLALRVSEWFLALTAFVGLNQLAFVAFGNCPSSWLLRRYAGLRGVIER